jgi:hypothetical protein
VLLLRLGLLRRIACQPGDGASNCTSNAIVYTLSKITHLALGLLTLALAVLLDALLLESLCADEAANGLLGGAHVLVPRALCAVRVVLRYAAGRGDGVGAGFGGCVGCLLLGFGDGLAVLALGLEQSQCVLDINTTAKGSILTYLVCGRSGQGAEYALSGASRRVDVALQRGGLVFVGGHGGCGDGGGGGRFE